MKILVIGGTKFFGKRLAYLLTQRGHELSVLSRGNSEVDFGPLVNRIKADRTMKNQLSSAVTNEKFDVVVDQYCMTGQEAKDAIDIFKDKTDYYLFTSTMAVYEMKGDRKENDFNPSIYTPENSNSYASGKREAEREFSLQTHFSCGFARFPVVLGPDDYTERLLNQVKRVQDGLPLYYPNLNAKFSFISSQDAAQSLLWMIENKSKGPYNFASPTPIVLKDLIQLIEVEASKKAILLNQPSEESRSPFGIENDCYLNIQKAHSQGHDCQDLSLWLPHLIKTYARRFQNEY